MITKFIIFMILLLTVNGTIEDNEDIDEEARLVFANFMQTNALNAENDQQNSNNNIKDPLLENNVLLVKNLLRLSKKMLNDLRKRNSSLINRIEQCNLNASSLKINKNSKIVDENQDFEDVGYLLTTIYDDFKIYFAELKRNNEVIVELRNTIKNLTNQVENCGSDEVKNTSQSILYKRAHDCSSLNVRGIVLIEYENTNIDVYCENNWLLIQRRQHGYGTNFNRTWLEYKFGFGSLRGEFWLGNDIIYKLTNAKNYKLRIELEDWSDNIYIADYDYFRIENEANYYRLHLSNSYKGNTSKDMLDDLTNGFSAHDKSYFQTYDHYVNSHSNKRLNCAHKTGGAWWFLNQTTCLPVNLNGIYVAGASSPPTKGIKWLAMNNHDKNYSLKKSKMKIQPIN